MKQETDVINKITFRCLIYILLIVLFFIIGIYTIIETHELINVCLGMAVILLIFYKLVNIEAKKIEKYLQEKEHK